MAKRITTCYGVHRTEEVIVEGLQLAGRRERGYLGWCDGVGVRIYCNNAVYELTKEEAILLGLW